MVYLIGNSVRKRVIPELLLCDVESLAGTPVIFVALVRVQLIELVLYVVLRPPTIDRSAPAIRARRIRLDRRYHAVLVEGVSSHVHTPRVTRSILLTTPVRRAQSGLFELLCRVHVPVRLIHHVHNCRVSESAVETVNARRRVIHMTELRCVQVTLVSCGVLLLRERRIETLGRAES